MSESVRRQVSTNIGMSMLKCIALVVCLRICDSVLSGVMLGVLLLFRRQGALWANLVQLGMSQCIQKFYPSQGSVVERNDFVLHAVRVVLIVGSIFVLLASVCGAEISAWSVGVESSGVALVFAFYVCALALGFIAGSAWMVEFRFVWANAVDLLHGSVLLIICVTVAAESSIEVFISLLTVLTALAAVGALVRFLSVGAGGCSGPRWSRNVWFRSSTVSSRKCAFYGGTRALAAFAELAVLTIGPWWLRAQPEAAGHLLLAYTGLRLVQYFAIPAAQVVALRTVSGRYDCDLESLRVFVLGLVVTFISFVVVGAHYLCGDVLLALWLPDSHLEVAAMLDVLMPFMPAISLFYTLRASVDLQYNFPWNLVFLGIAVGAFVVHLSVAGTVDRVWTATLASCWMFGVLYVYDAFFMLALAFRVRETSVPCGRFPTWTRR